MHRPTLAKITRTLAALSILLIPLYGANSGPHQAVSVEASGQSSCIDTAADCKPPVKYLGDNKGCSCFVCEYGRKTQKVRCTEKETEKYKFRNLLPKGKSALVEQP